MHTSDNLCCFRTNLSLSRNGVNQQAMPGKSFQDALDHSIFLGVPKKCP